LLLSAFVSAFVIALTILRISNTSSEPFLLIIFILPFSSFCSVFSPAPSLCDPYFNYSNTKYSALQSPKHTILYFQNKSHITEEFHVTRIFQIFCSAKKDRKVNCQSLFCPKPFSYSLHPAYAH